MNIRQLRAGNLVTTNGNPAGTTNGNIYKILDTDSANRLDELRGSATIATKEIQYHSFVDVWAKDLEPIEITDELLDKIGFQDRLGIFENKIENYGIEFLLNNKVLPPLSYLHIYDTSNKGKFKLGADVKYLHTLQNLIFDVTDLELDVENLISK